MSVTWNKSQGNDIIIDQASPSIQYEERSESSGPRSATPNAALAVRSPVVCDSIIDEDIGPERSLYRLTRPFDLSSLR